MKFATRYLCKLTHHFLQACRGKLYDVGHKVAVDVPDCVKFIKIPTWADFLIAYSTVEGYYSWRSCGHGSWFIQSLVDVLNHEKATELDLLSILTIVNRTVAYNYSSRTNCPETDAMKQVPCVTTMLTRRLVFKTTDMAFATRI